MPLKLYYNEPAKEHVESIPIGNGQLGGMIFGGINKEKISLNDEWFWSGYERFKGNGKAKDNLEEVRSLILKGENYKAQRLIEDTMLGEFSEGYLPVGDLEFSFNNKGDVSGYRLELDLEEALVKVSYDNHKREYFASYPDKAIYMKLEEDKPFDVEVAYKKPDGLEGEVTAETSSINIDLKAPEHVMPSYLDVSDEEAVVQGSLGHVYSYEIVIKDTNGRVEVSGEKLNLTDATYAVVVFRVRSSDQLRSFEEAKKRHIADYRELFTQVELNLGEEVDLPTDERVERLKQGEEDPHLIQVYFQYCRYLLISSSRPGGLPANLQGIWNWELRPPWSSNWTTNINSSMNYWEVCKVGLGECFQPYIDWVCNITKSGQKTAKEYYDMPGSVCHHNVDRWYLTSPVGVKYGEDKADDGAANWAFWPMGLAWMVGDICRYQDYVQDKAFLEERLYPIITESVKFLNAYLVEVDGVYHTIPSTSPENTFYDEEGRVCYVDKSTTMDLSLVRENFLRYLSYSKELGIENDLVEEVKEKLDKLAKPKLGSKGQVLEYFEEFPEAEPGHRHVSHLYGAYPGEEFDEEFLEGTRVTIELRKENGGGHTGWSNAWLMNLYTRLGDGESAYSHLVHGITNASYKNLWSAHPPFQIDGNFGSMAGLANMFVYEYQGDLKLLPALPKALENGSLKGFCLTNNRRLDMTWEKGQVVEYRVY